MTQTSGPGETAGARVFSLTRMYVRYSFAPVSAYVGKGHGPLLVAVCAGLFCMPFMMAGVSAVLPLLGEELHATARELGLIGAAYVLGLAVFQLGGGSMGDIWGYRRVFLWGTALFALAGAAQGFVPSVGLLPLLPLRFSSELAARLSTPAGWPCWPQPRHKAAVRPIFVSAAPQFRGCSVQPGCRRNSGGHPWLSLAIPNASLHGVIIPCFMTPLC